MGMGLMLISKSRPLPLPSLLPIDAPTSIVAMVATPREYDRRRFDTTG